MNDTFGVLLYTGDTKIRIQKQFIHNLLFASPKVLISIAHCTMNLLVSYKLIKHLKSLVILRALNTGSKETLSLDQFQV